MSLFGNKNKKAAAEAALAAAGVVAEETAQDAPLPKAPEVPLEEKKPAPVDPLAEVSEKAMDAAEVSPTGVPRPVVGRVNGQRVLLTREMVRKAGARDRTGAPIYPDQAEDLSRVRVWKEQLEAWESGVRM